MLDLSLYNQVLDELHEVLWYLILYFQGEPYLHPQFFELVKSASSRNIYTATSTNAHYLTSDNARKTVESGLDRLIISIDGTTQKTYENYRVGGKLDRVISGTREMVAWKNKLRSTTPHLIFQFLVVKPNEHQISEVESLAEQLGVDDVVLKTAQIYDYKQGSPLIPENDRYSRYHRKSDGSFELKNQLLNHCWKMWHSSVITWDGQVVPCCFDKDASHAMGDLKTKKFQELWHGEKYRSFRKNLLKARSEIDICTNCTEGMQVSWEQ
jgi:radical SAM protein with 4Fe4S-binding SPASM domain